jgi:hypothetical protein
MSLSVSEELLRRMWPAGDQKIPEDDYLSQGDNSELFNVFATDRNHHRNVAC